MKPNWRKWRGTSSGGTTSWSKQCDVTPTRIYASGRVMVVGHPADAALNKAVAGYAALLIDPPSSMVVRPINQIVAAWKPVVAGTERAQWLDDFHDRYVDLSLSQGA